MNHEIHATATVEPSAELEDGCVIGPQCYIGGNVRLGAGTILHSHVVIDGPTTLGKNCEIFPFACIGKRTQDLKYEGGSMPVTIGDNTTIREYVTVHQPTKQGSITSVGDHCSLLAYCHIAHDCRIGNRVIVSNSTNFAGHVDVGDSAVIGGMCGVHQFARIGSYVMLSAMSKAVQDIPPFCLADGNPARLVSINKIGLQRNGFTKEQIQNIHTAFRTLFRSANTLHEGINELRQRESLDAHIQQLKDFIETSDRQIATVRNA